MLCNIHSNALDVTREAHGGLATAYLDSKIIAELTTAKIQGKLDYRRKSNFEDEKTYMQVTLKYICQKKKKHINLLDFFSPNQQVGKLMISCPSSIF